MPERRIIRLKRTRSTMQDAAGFPPGTVVVADEQTAGRGRLGRPWHSEAGTGLYFSYVLEPPGEGAALPIVTLALGLAVQEAVQRVAGDSCDLRWPNDVLLNEKKCAGILVELHGGKLVAGVGVNVNQMRFPEALAGIATSLRIETGREHSREELLAQILDAIDAYRALLAEQGPEAILRLYSRASSYVTGRPVIVEGAEAAFEGVTDGLDASGFLWVKTAGGRRRLVRAGGVRPLRNVR